MNRKRIYIFVTLLISTVLVIVLWHASDTPERETVASSQNETTSSNQAAMSGDSPVPPGPSQAGSESVDETHKENVRHGLETIFEGLKKMGAEEVPPIAETLKEAVATGDPGTMLRAFHEAIYGRFVRMSEAIPAIRAYLGSPEPYVRYLAAEALLRVGDPSGVETLLQMVRSDEAISQGTRDLRFAAATTLGAFNIVDAAESIRDLYSRTKEGELLRSLASLGIQAKEAGEWRYVPSALAIENYAKVGSTRFIPQIVETFEQTNDLRIKNAAAWALARMTGADQYVNYLSEAARPAIEREEKGSRSYDDSTRALKYLGSIQSPQAVQVLETALESQNPVAVQYATVNLLFNQPGGSQKAEQLVIKELQTSPRVLGTELTMQIASKLDNPQIRAAAESFAARTGSDSWRYWGVERADWPVQNWIYDYVITLNP